MAAPLSSIPISEVKSDPIVLAAVRYTYHNVVQQLGANTNKKNTLTAARMEEVYHLRFPQNHLKNRRVRHLIYFCFAGCEVHWFSFICLFS